VFDSLDARFSITVIGNRTGDKIGAFFVFGIQHEVKVADLVKAVSKLLILGEEVLVLNGSFQKTIHNVHKVQSAERITSLAAGQAM
jgi:hypothetical protein